ncbi:gliding motility-associated C-terminal domain-containing protein [Mariniflexile ostreae]|uniref:Gliding motility-associated C-terminal domain-containing protein n=1 Tax=Mariniflexile ostreae TaxID=1520892 RepID=A0ABV5F860_9FLAO
MSKLYAIKLKAFINPIPMALVFMVLLSLKSFSQIRVPFNSRTSHFTPSKTTYNVKGDFTMLGNTNLTLINYEDDAHNGYKDMRYVDIDNDPNTLNSSRAELKLSDENGADPNCSNIIYAGLYWTGRSERDEVFGVMTSQTGHNEIYDGTSYTMTVSREGSANNYYPRYTFTASGSGTPVIFESLNSNNYQVRYSTNGGTTWAIANNQTVLSKTPNNDSVIISFDPITFGSGNNKLSIRALQRDEDFNENEYNNRIHAFAVQGKEFNKRKISLKGPMASSYTEFTADANDIYYPSGTDNDIFSGYTEVTDYVKTNGIGDYYVADIALREGNGSNIGYFGGWGMVVVYENSKMNWRDITIFDGHGFVDNNGVRDFELPVSGFNTAQNGNVNVKLGIMAGEGDNYYGGDYFNIRNAANTQWVPLSHSGNTANNFFNSSIITGNNTRFPNLINNTGLDINMFEIDNTNNAIIGNNQTSTTFQYGTSTDTYAIFNIVFSADAYVPETEGILTTTAINGHTPLSHATILPGEEVDYVLEIKNKGTEATENTVLTIPVPYTSKYKELSIAYHTYGPFSTPNAPYYNPNLGATGSIVWNLGTLPVSASPSDVLADISFSLSATKDCSILVNANCDSRIAVGGTITGEGAISKVAFNQQLIQGYETMGTCIGEPIPTPNIVTIDAEDYVNANCGDFTAIRDFFFCNIGTTAIETSKVKDAFPPGSKFYNEYPLTGTSVQYNASNPFPPTVGTSTYYAIHPGSSSCYYEFTIEVTSITSVPTVQDISYCLNETALPLSAVPSDAPTTPSAYTIYYYADNNPLTSAQSTIVPATTTAGETIYYAAEGYSNSCISPNRVPIKVTVRKAIEITIETIKNVSCNAGSDGAIAISVTEGSGNYTYEWDRNDTAIPDSNREDLENLMIGTYTLTVTDNDTECSVSKTFEVVTAIDVINPTITCPADITLNVDEDACEATNVTLETPITADNCGVATVEHDAPSNFPMGNTIVIWTVTDHAGNIQTCEQTVTVIDTIKPTIICPSNLSVNVDAEACDATNVTLELPTTADNCGVATVENDAPSSFPIGNTIVTWTVTDHAGNIQTCEQTVTVLDHTPPVFVESLPVDATYECDRVPDAKTLTATDACGTAEVTFNEERIEGACTSNYLLKRTWVATDLSGLTTSYTQTITVQDTQAPQTTTAFDKTIAVICDNIPAIPNLEFTDNCSTEVTVLFEETNAFDENNPSDYEIVRTWTVADACNNEAVFTQTVSVTLNELVTTTSDRACSDDGTIDLNDYLTNTDTSGTWTLMEGDALLDQHIFDPENVVLGDYKFHYTVANNGCLSTTFLTLEIHDECIVLPCGKEDVVISKVVTPNGDTFNDYFTIEGIETCGFVVELQIFNRWGAKIYENFNYKNDWNGYAHKSSVGNSDKVPNGTYYYIINLKDSGLKPFAKAFYIGTK